jgi:hypothetical protein
MVVSFQFEEGGPAPTDVAFQADDFTVCLNNATKGGSLPLSLWRLLMGLAFRRRPRYMAHANKFAPSGFWNGRRSNVGKVLREAVADEGPGGFRRF